MLRRVKAPSELVSAEAVKAERAAARAMCAPGSGRCWESWTTPWRWENTVARAAKAGSLEKGARGGGCAEGRKTKARRGLGIGGAGARMGTTESGRTAVSIAVARAGRWIAVG